ncbi:MAG TPA: hypothetical protein VG838_00510 [Opitutaceae bacterium]|nr:hypothetical protein [Opitutaceae bacterium]
MKSQRGAIPVLVLYAVAALAATQLVPNWRLSNLFQKGPPTKELVAAQADLERAKAEAATAQAALAAATAERDSRMKQQVASGQQMVAGVQAALSRAPQGPEVKLAAGLAGRASLALSSAIGDLPADKQAEIQVIVEQALSSKQAEIDAANAALIKKDVELAQTTAARAAAEAKIPALEADRDAATARAAIAQASVTEKTGQIVKYAEAAARDKSENGSLGALVRKLGWVIVIAGLLYLLAHFLLPSIAQEFPNVGALQTLNKTVKSLTSAHV